MAARARSARSDPPASLSAGLATRIHVGGDPSDYAIAVLEAVTKIPPGAVMTYGDVAEYVGSGTGRHVGAVLSRFGDEGFGDESAGDQGAGDQGAGSGGLPWHRVVRSTGEPNPTAPGEAIRRLVADATAMRPGGTRVDLAAARWDGRA